MHQVRAALFCGCLFFWLYCLHFRGTPFNDHIVGRFWDLLFLRDVARNKEKLERYRTWGEDYPLLVCNPRGSEAFYGRGAKGQECEPAERNYWRGGATQSRNRNDRMLILFLPAY